MALQVEDIENQDTYNHILTLPYSNLLPFILETLKKQTRLTVVFWSICIISLVFAISVRLSISAYFPALDIILHSTIGMLVLPILAIPVHELLHIIPYYISGARNIRVGMDMNQYLFYVTAHKYVASAKQFIIVAIFPFIVISTSLLILIFTLPGLWKWSLSIFLFIHSTMCAGDFALLNYYAINKGKQIYTWDDVDKKEAYFYEKLRMI